MMRLVKSFAGAGGERGAAVFFDLHAGDYVVKRSIIGEQAPEDQRFDTTPEAIDAAEEFIEVSGDAAACKCGACVFCLSGQRG